ncbi:MAG: hypothetical protein FJ006_12195 [Chloroflexi bacterium]|nr:hypothetical protein [Chloroflexota bacterium]
MPKLDFEAVEELQAVGFSSEQGKALVRIIANMQTAQLATKADLAGLRTELVETREVLRGEIVAVRTEMRTEMAELRTEMRSEMAELRTEMAEMRATMTTLATKDELASLELRLTEKMSAMFAKMIIWLVGIAIASVSLMAAIGQLMK